LDRHCNRRIVALSQENRANEATFRDLESNIQRAGEVPTTEKPVKLGGMLIDDPPPFTTVETRETHLVDLKKVPECLSIESRGRFLSTRTMIGRLSLPRRARACRYERQPPMKLTKIDVAKAHLITAVRLLFRAEHPASHKIRMVC
jgi:hypothetical protein